MLRRDLLALPCAAFAARGQKAKTGADPDTFIASASEDTTPRVAIVLSNFRGSKDHDGTTLAGLRSPTAVDAPVGAAQLEDMVRRAIDLGNTRRGDLAALVGAEEWIVVKPQIIAHGNSGGAAVPVSVADPRVVKAVIKWLAEHRAGKRITIAEAPLCSAAEYDPWTSDWGGIFGKVSYRGILNDLAREYPRVHFELVDLNRDETMDMQTPSRTGASDSGVYKVASTLLRCGALVTVAPLATSTATGVSLTLGSYLGAVSAAAYGPTKEKISALGPIAEVLVDLFSFRPPDYTIVGGEWVFADGGVRGPNATPVRHNVILSGANAVAVDAVAASVMGFGPSRIAHLAVASRRGLGTIDLDAIWTRGNEIGEARRSFRSN